MSQHVVGNRHHLVHRQRQSALLRSSGLNRMVGVGRYKPSSCQFPLPRGSEPQKKATFNQCGASALSEDLPGANAATAVWQSLTELLVGVLVGEVLAGQSPYMYQLSFLLAGRVPWLFFFCGSEPRGVCQPPCCFFSSLPYPCECQRASERPRSESLHRFKTHVREQCHDILRTQTAKQGTDCSISFRRLQATALSSRPSRAPRGW